MNLFRGQKVKCQSHVIAKCKNIPSSTRYVAYACKCGGRILEQLTVNSQQLFLYTPSYRQYAGREKYHYFVLLVCYRSSCHYIAVPVLY